MRYIAVLTTVATRQQAQALAHALVERGLVACAQIGAIDSYYRWNGAVAHEAEHRLVCKTTAEAYPAVEAAIRALHPYEVPAIYAVPLEAVYAPYAAWIDASVTMRPA